MKNNTQLLQELNEVRTQQKSFVSMNDFIKFLELKNERKRVIMEQIKFNIQNN